jgi:predicted DNA-binding transcriptional regulator AlpA
MGDQELAHFLGSIRSAIDRTVAMRQLPLSLSLGALSGAAAAAEPTAQQKQDENL